MEGGIAMAGGTFLRRAFEHIIYVTLLTFHIGMRAIQLESRQVMVKGSWFPTRDFVTGAAILSKFSLMLIILFMAGKTGAGSTLEHAIHMAVGAFHIGMLAFQFEC